MMIIVIYMDQKNGKNKLNRKKINKIKIIIKINLY